MFAQPWISRRAPALAVYTVRAASTAAGVTRSGEQTVDDVALVAGDRYLEKDAATAAERGIYLVAAGAWPRVADFDDGLEVRAGVLISVAEGTANADHVFALSSDGPVTVGTTALTFTDASGLNVLAAGTGLSKSGNTLSLAAAIYGLVGDLSTVNAGDAASAGATGRFADAAHQHAVATAAPAAGGIATTASEGTSVSLSRADHQHPMGSTYEPFQLLSEFIVGAEAGNVIRVSIRAKTPNGAELTTRACRWWLSDSNADPTPTATPPDGGIAYVDGVSLETITANVQEVAVGKTTSSGRIVLDLTHSAARTWYMWAARGGRVDVSGAITFV